MRHECKPVKVGNDVQGYRRQGAYTATQADDKASKSVTFHKVAGHLYANFVE